MDKREYSHIFVFIVIMLRHHIKCLLKWVFISIRYAYLELPIDFKEVCASIFQHRVATFKPRIMKNKAFVLVITTQTEEQTVIQQAFGAYGIKVDTLMTLFDFYVESYLKDQGPYYRPNHILVDLSMGYQPALDIIFFLKTFAQTRHIPVSVYSEHESACIGQCLEQNGVDSLLVKSSSWRVLTNLFVQAYPQLAGQLLLDKSTSYTEVFAA